MASIKKLFLGLFVVLIAQSAHAGLWYTNDVAHLGSTHAVNWSDFGPEFTDVPSGSVLGNVAVTGADRFTTLSGSTYNADFYPDDTLLALLDSATFEAVDGSFNLLFSKPVFGIGTQIQNMLFGDFSGFVSAYNSNNVLLGMFAVSGTNGGNGDGSAVFAGVRSDSKNISRIEYSGFGAGAAINGLNVNDVPEPGTILLAFTALALLFAVRRRA